MKPIRLNMAIVSPEKTIFKGEVDSVMVPGTKGRFTVLPRHAALVSSLEQGQIAYRIAGTDYTCEIKGGFIEVSDNSVSICVE